jgi:hypothetical protein
MRIAPRVAANAVQAKPQSKVQHFKVAVSDVSFRHGTGMMLPPGGHSSGPAISVTAQVPFADLKPTFKVKVDEKTHTVTVTVDASSSSKAHPGKMTKAEDYTIPISRPKDMNEKYSLVVKDIHGKTLKRSSFVNLMPC